MADPPLFGALAPMGQPVDWRAQFAAALQPPPHGYDAQTAPKPLQSLYGALAPDPSADYGTILPFARDKETGDKRFAMPSLLREGLLGVTDLLAGVDTGQVTPRAAETLAMGGMGTGGMLAPRGALAAGGAPIRAYHGSPHNFERFDASKIGTGEGAQAYGHGLYFAEREGIAKQYRDKLSSGLYETNQGILPHHEVWNGASAAAQAASPMPLSSSDRIASNILDGVKQAGSIEKYLKQYDLPGGQYGDAYRAAADHIASLQARMHPGSMYEVNIHAAPNKFLDWDKPLAGQSPEVFDKANRALRYNIDSVKDDMKGAELYRQLTNSQFIRPLDSAPNNLPALQARATNVLRDAGIPGIKYLDGGSRAAGDGSSNYVVFPGNENLVEIIRKYMMGIPAPVAMPQGSPAAFGSLTPGAANGER